MVVASVYACRACASNACANTHYIGASDGQPNRRTNAYSPTYGDTIFDCVFDGEHVHANCDGVSGSSCSNTACAADHDPRRERVRAR